MQTPLLAGRDFSQTDTPTSPRVAIVNKPSPASSWAVKIHWGEYSTILEKPGQTYQIVGLVKDTKYYDLRENPTPIAFVSFTQANGPEEHSKVVIRSDEPLLSLFSSTKRAAHDMNPSLVLTFSVLKTQIREGLLRERLMSTPGSLACWPRFWR